MPDLGTEVVGSLRDLADFHRASPISTWAGQNLDAQVTRSLRHKDCKSDDSEVTLRERIPCIEDKTVMV